MWTKTRQCSTCTAWRLWRCVRDTSRGQRVKRHRSAGSGLAQGIDECAAEDHPLGCHPYVPPRALGFGRRWGSLRVGFRALAGPAPRRQRGCLCYPWVVRIGGAGALGARDLVLMSTQLGAMQRQLAVFGAALGTAGLEIWGSRLGTSKQRGRSRSFATQRGTTAPLTAALGGPAHPRTCSPLLGVALGAPDRERRRPNRTFATASRVTRAPRSAPPRSLAGVVDHLLGAGFAPWAGETPAKLSLRRGAADMGPCRLAEGIAKAQDLTNDHICALSAGVWCRRRGRGSLSMARRCTCEGLTPQGPRPRATPKNPPPLTAELGVSLRLSEVEPVGLVSAHRGARRSGPPRPPRSGRISVSMMHRVVGHSLCSRWSGSAGRPLPIYMGRRQGTSDSPTMCSSVADVLAECCEGGGAVLNVSWMLRAESDANTAAAAPNLTLSTWADGVVLVGTRVGDMVAMFRIPEAFVQSRSRLFLGRPSHGARKPVLDKVLWPSHA